MAKKLGRPKGSKNKNKNKREVTNLQDAMKQAKTGDTILVAPNTVSAESPEPYRANKSSYVLIMGTRVSIRDLSHESLCDRYTLIKNETSNLRRELMNLEELESNLRAEKFYRNL